MKFIQYPRCSTCVKARKLLEQENILFENRHIIDNPLSPTELKNLIQKSQLPIKKFFNTSGVVYRELNLKDKINSMHDDELIELLASNGKLVKRPLLETNTTVLVGFNQEDYLNAIK